MKQLIACCGLDCEGCDARIATLHDDDALREKTAVLWSQLNGVQITAEMINCTGCRAPGAKTPFCSDFCRIRKCAMDKRLETCGDCPELEHCEVLSAITGNNPQALRNLKGES